MISKTFISRLAAAGVIPGHGAISKKTDIAAWIEVFEALEGDFANPSAFFERAFPAMWDELAAK